jgi:hypothetical protein
VKIDDVLARPEDEYPHQLPRDRDGRPWKDTWWFGFRDDAADVTAALHLTLSPNRHPGCRITVAVRHGGAQVVDWTSTAADAGGAAFGGPWLGVDVVDPEWSSAKRLRLHLRHPLVSGDLEMRGRFLGPLVGAVAPGLVPSGEDSVALAGHVEQLASFSGTLRLADRDTPIDATGFRDRSWGFRKSDRMAPRGTILVAADLGDRACALLSWSPPSAGPDHPVPVGGWLADEERVVAAIAGRYVRDSAGRPTALEVKFADGTIVRSQALQATGEIQYAFHEPEYDGPAVGTIVVDHHFRSPEIRWGFADHGIPFAADPWRDADWKCASSIGE